MPRLVDDALGRIRHILLTLPDFAVVEFGDTLRIVIDALPSYARLDILAGPAQSDVVESWVWDREGARVHHASAGLDFSHWAQDAVGGIEGENGPALILSKRFARHDDARAALQLAEFAEYSVQRIETGYDGGNVLVQGDQVVVGADLGTSAELDRSRRMIVLESRAPRPAEVRKPSSILPKGWRETVRSGVAEGNRQPLFHIDLFLAPAGIAPDGRPRWLVGCPRLGAEVLGIDLLDHADPDQFDDVAAILAKHGSEVIRNPQPLIWSDRLSAQLRTWFHLPVNNVLVEAGTDQPAVWLPCFENEVWPELRKIDSANAKIWRDLGFHVCKVPACLPLAERRGALRCMCNVVARDPPDPT